MRFTLWSVVFPFLLAGIQLQLAPHSRLGWPSGPLFFLTMVWFWCGVPCAVVYWLVRIARLAWRQGTTAPAATLEINSTEPDTGRIFGRLN
jgi:hypothetical protein